MKKPLWKFQYVKLTFVLFSLLLSLSPLTPSLQTEAKKSKVEKLEQSGLAEDKIAKIKELKTSYEERLKAQKKQVSQELKLLRKELKKDNLDLEKLKELNQKIHKSKEEAKLVQLEYQYELSKILKAKERKNLKKALKLKTKK